MTRCIAAASVTPVTPRVNSSISARRASRAAVISPRRSSIVVAAAKTSPDNDNNDSTSSSPPSMFRRIALALGLASVASSSSSSARADDAPIPADLPQTEEEWKQKLSPESFYVLRKHGTERPFTSPLNKEKRKGTFICAGCGSKLFSSSAKYDSYVVFFFFSILFKRRRRRKSSYHFALSLSLVSSRPLAHFPSKYHRPLTFFSPNPEKKTFK
jgi:SelR domain